MAYIFNWADAEFLLPCSGDYKFTAYVTARYIDATGTPVEESGPKTTIDITLHKKDESTNWGPGLPNTTVESYDLGQIKGKNKTIIIEEADYTWTIHGNDIETVPDANLSLKITANPDDFAYEGIDDFFGETLVLKFNIEHNGEFGFTAILDYRIGAEYSGKYANLFYVVGDGTFEYVDGSPVDENGVTTFTFSHASDYVLAVTDEEYTGQELNPKPEEPTPSPQPESTMVPSTEEFSATETTTPSPEETPQPQATQNPDNEASVSTANTTAPDSATSDTNSLLPWLILGGVSLVVVMIIVILLLKKR